MMQENPLLKIRNLTIDAWIEEDWRPVVNNISLDLRQGEVLGLIGESGAGKSTLGLAAMGYTRSGCRISDGSVHFDGQDLVTLPEKERQALRGKKIAYVAQSAAASFNPAFKLIDQHVETFSIHNIGSKSEAMKGAVNLYRNLNLPDPENIGFRYPHQVSGGQLQRAMIAMAMACKPDLIIFDEPTTALDVTTQIEVLVAMRKIVREFNTAAIYITHDLAVVAQMADRIKVLKNGFEIEEAPTGVMLENPCEDYTKSLWAVRSFRATPKPIVEETQKPLLEIEGLFAGYGDVPVLKNVGFRVHQGRTVAIVGESGSGKSTVARVISGLLPPTEGRLSFQGDVLASSFKERARDNLRDIQMIYQNADTALNPKQKIGDIIGRPAAFYLGLRGKALQERVRELLRAIELEPDRFIDRYPSELSGGEKQRVGIARALAAEPRLIICDEITSALDQLVAEEILKLLDQAQQSFDLTYLFITHDLATVRAIADDVVIMKDGAVVEAGQKEVIMSPPHHRYTEKLLSSVPEMDPDWLTHLLGNPRIRP